jgi:hypothetical protein
MLCTHLHHKRRQNAVTNSHSRLADMGADLRNYTNVLFSEVPRLA